MDLTRGSFAFVSSYRMSTVASFDFWSRYSLVLTKAIGQLVPVRSRSGTCFLRCCVERDDWLD